MPTYIRDDEPTRSLGASRSHRNVCHQAAVSEHHAIDRLGVKDQRDGHAGPDGVSQVPTAEDHSFAIGQIGCDCAERNGERIEVPLAMRLPRRSAAFSFELRATSCTAG